MEYKRGLRAPRRTEEESAWLRVSKQGAMEFPKLHLRWLVVALLDNIFSMLKSLHFSAVLLGLGLGLDEGTHILDSALEISALFLESNKALDSFLPSGATGLRLSVTPVWCVGAPSLSVSCHGVLASVLELLRGFWATGNQSWVKLAG